MAEKGLNPDGLVFQEGYTETMDQTVIPWLAAHRKDERIPARDGKSLYVSRFDADSARGTVLVVHGFTESSEKFLELTHSLLRQGWSVVSYDQRGHGRSWRDERITDGSLTHIDHFETYVQDLETVCEKMLRKMPKLWMIFCHSMGGAVTSLFLEKHPDVFEKAVFCAPMIACSRGGLPLFVGKTLCRCAKALGQGRKRIFMSKPFAGPEDFATACASGRERFDWYDAMRVRTPALQNNGPSYSWTLEALKVTDRILAPGEVEKIRIPVVVYGAEDDSQVLPEQQILFADRLPNGKRKVVPGSRHEIYRSPDAVLFPWWHEILNFLETGKLPQS